MTIARPVQVAEPTQDEALLLPALPVKTVEELKVSPAVREVRPQPSTGTMADPEETLITGNVGVATLALKLQMAKAAGAFEVAELERQYADAGRVQARLLEQAGYRASRDSGEPH